LHGLRVTAVVVLIAALVLRWVAVLSLGKAFSANVAIRETQRVRTVGLYRWMRHPSYTGLMLCFVAVGLHTRNWVAFLIVTALPAGALLYRIHVEEIALREHFGQEYIDYSVRTKRLIPGIY
jgi:protein-S-isoprenylcysteine O-methyltransferase Ste14